MAIPHAQKLLVSAQSGERLKAAERRHVIEYLMATQAGVTNSQMAEWFGVSERTVRMDKVAIRQQKANYLREELKKDVSLVIADIAMDYENQVRDIEKSKAKAKLGSKAYLDHCTQIMDLRLKMTRAFQDMGYLPKTLGTSVTERYEYKAIVLKDGSVDTRAIREDERRKAFDVEFADIPALPAQVVKNENGTQESTPKNSSPSTSSGDGKVEASNTGTSPGPSEAV